MFLVTKLSIGISLLIHLNKMPILKAYEHIQKELPPICHTRISSYHRTPEHNRKVGGVDGSFHIKKRALDIITNCKTLLKEKALKGGLSVILYPTHIHIDNRDNQVCLIREPNGFKNC